MRGLSVLEAVQEGCDRIEEANPSDQGDDVYQDLLCCCESCTSHHETVPLAARVTTRASPSPQGRPRESPCVCKTFLNGRRISPIQCASISCPTYLPLLHIGLCAGLPANSFIMLWVCSFSACCVRFCATASDCRSVLLAPKYIDFFALESHEVLTVR